MARKTCLAHRNGEMKPSGKRYAVSVFGGLQIFCPDGSVAQLQTLRARALFVLLLINRERMVHRDVLCSLLWPDLDETSARSQLRKALWRLKSAFMPPGSREDDPVVRIFDHQVGLNDARIDADYWRFSDAMSSLELKSDGDLTISDAEALLTAIDLNRDTFAAGIFDDWCLAEQEVMREARLAAMERMVAYHRQQEHWVQAAHWARQALVLDPIREHLHHAVMACRNAMGDRASAIRQYMLCEEVLDRELGIAPSPALRALRHSIADRPGAEAAIGDAELGINRNEAGRSSRLARDVDPTQPRRSTTPGRL